VRPGDETAREARRRRVRRALLGGVGVLYVVSVPWYRGPDTAPVIVLGVPDWVLVAFCCYVGVAVMNAVAWLLADIRDGEEDAP